MTWLELVDTEDYQASYDNAGGFLQSNMTPIKFVSAMVDMKLKLGKVSERNFSSFYLTNKRSYSVVSYQLMCEGSLESRKETVTLQLEEDGVWRVIGYFIE